MTVKLVGNGDVDFGYATADQAMLANARGLPVVATAVVLQSNPTAIVFPKSEGIKKLSDLYGKRLGLQLKSAVERQWRAVAKMQNIDTSKINEVPADLAVAQLIIAHRIDAGVAFFFNDGIRPISEGIDMDWLMFSYSACKTTAQAFWLMRTRSKRIPIWSPDSPRPLSAAGSTVKDHPDEAYAMTIKANPTLDNKYNQLKLPAVLGVSSTAPRSRPTASAIRAGRVGKCCRKR